MNPIGEKKAPGTPVKRARRNASNVLDHFRIVIDRRYCIEANCSKSYSLNSATTTLMYHLSSVHQINCIDDEVEDEKDSEKENMPSASKSNSKLSHKRQEIINDLLIKFIVEDYQAFDVTNSESFRDFLFALNPGYVLPDPKTVKQKILEKFNTLQPKIEKLLSESDSLKSWTTDGWSASSTEPYLIITSAFIDKEFKYFNITYDFSLFPHPHDHVNMSEKLFEVNLS